MKRKSILKNNKGGGLILVIGCVALLSLIGAMLLVVTTNNRKMKDLEYQMQKSFYGAESGSDELVSQLEIEAEDALKRAFADLMVQYSHLDTTDDRNARFSQFFQTAFYDEVTKSDAARKLMCEALGGNPDTDDLDALDVQVSFGAVPTPVPYVSGSGEDSTQICLKNVTFTYSAGGSQTSITTDIIVDAKIPDVEGNMANTVACDFMDFAIITGGDVVTPLNTSQTVKVNGNFYTRNSLLHRSNLMEMNVENAKKFLVAGDLVVTNGAKLTINTGSLASGDGVWARGVEVSDGGELSANTNFYVSDDLTIEKTGAKVDIDGNEYIGYSGGDASVDPSAANSAITINTAKDITLDFSGTGNLVLNGRSYIRDTLWNAGGAANALGILQGESVAYKDMQSMYLVPNECLVTNHNPMTLTEFNTLTGCLMTDAKISYRSDSNGLTNYFDFRQYIGKSSDPADPNYALTESDYVVRHVKLDGGTTEFVYLYLNFPTDQDAQRYFAAYMAIPELARPMKMRLATIGNSTIKLAQNNYTLANAFRYDYSAPADTSYGIQHATTDYAQLVNSSLLAKRRTGGLFTSFRLNATSTENRDFDIISEKILKMDKFDPSNPACTPTNTWIKRDYTINSTTYDFWVYNGDVTISDTVPTHSGIILVNGKLTFSGTSKTINGLVVATGGVEFNSATTLNCDKTAVEALLTEADVQEYFRATGGGGTPANPYLSSEAVSISFDNWKKN